MAVTKVTAPEMKSIVFTTEAFTADLSAAAAQPVAATERMKILGWSLILTSNTANAVVQIKATTAGTVYAENRFAASTATRGDWTVCAPNAGYGFSLPAGDTLTIGGGGTAGQLSGVVWYQIETA